MNEARVWISSRKLKSGKRSYYLRWIDPGTGKWRNQKVGTDRKRAEREAAKHEDKLQQGTYVDVQRIGWAQFVQEHLATKKASAHRDGIERTLLGFGEVCNPAGPHAITYAMLERYDAYLSQHGNPPIKPRGNKEKPSAIATRNLRLRILRAALNKAVKRGYVAKSPMGDWVWEAEDSPAPRALDGTEKKALLSASPDHRWQTFIHVGYSTGCRLNEIRRLAWDRVSFDRAEIHVTETKGKRDRVIPLTPQAVQMLRKLQASTLKDGGPFLGMGHTRTIQKHFDDIVTAAKIKRCTIHNLRDTFCTDLARAGINQKIVQELAGHESIATTAKYYQYVPDDAKRDAVRRAASVA